MVDRASREPFTFQRGRLILIQGQQPIAGDAPSVQMPLGTLLQTSYTLSLNRWDQKSGALGLLSQGSIIHNDYQEYRDRLEKTAKLTWNAKANASEYARQTATLSLQSTGTIDVAFADPQLWTVVQRSDIPVKPSQKSTTVVSINMNLGALPVDTDVFKTGADLEIEITATRSLGTRSTQKTIDWSGTVY